MFALFRERPFYILRPFTYSEPFCKKSKYEIIHLIDSWLFNTMQRLKISDYRNHLKRLKKCCHFKLRNLKAQVWPLFYSVRETESFIWNKCKKSHIFLILCPNNWVSCHKSFRVWKCNASVLKKLCRTMEVLLYLHLSKNFCLRNYVWGIWDNEMVCSYNTLNKSETTIISSALLVLSFIISHFYICTLMLVRIFQNFPCAYFVFFIHIT